MENNKLTSTIMDLLSSHLMISIRNIAVRCGTDITTLTPFLKQLEVEGVIRIAASKGCSSSCSSCNSCGPAIGTDHISEDSTVISTLFSRTEENVD